jgi:hypothetical protein
MNRDFTTESQFLKKDAERYTLFQDKHILHNNKKMQDLILNEQRAEETVKI